MKQFLDFLPLVVFFAFYKIYDIYAATSALIVATAVVLIYSWVRYRKVEKMALITFVLVAVFGGLTLFFHNDEFIKWKVTVIYALFAGALAPIARSALTGCPAEISWIISRIPPARMALPISPANVEAAEDCSRICCCSGVMFCTRSNRPVLPVR